MVRPGPDFWRLDHSATARLRTLMTVPSHLPPSPALPTKPHSELASERIRKIQKLDTSQVLRAPPPEPTTCCGRGCNGCVWESYHAALDYWCEEALLKLAPIQPGPG